MILAVIAAGCSAGGVDVDLDKARSFQRYPLYWAGERFERWTLSAVLDPDGKAELITLIYGTCRPHDGGQSSCAPFVHSTAFHL